jgi:hypothetical protein
MMKKIISVSLFIILILAYGTVFAADVVPNEIMMPGTQPNEVSGLESPDKCDNCHGGYDEGYAYSNEPAYGWRGSAMGNAGRDPIFWATLAIAEQDFDGAGDLCIRCHSTGGWIGGRSTPTDGSGLALSDDDGVDCDACHKATNPDNSEHQGVMNEGFQANDGAGEGYYGSGMLSLWGGSDKLGPYNDAEARHQWMESDFHRGDICGSCHDVSNPAVGDLAPGNGTQPGAPIPISSGGNLGGPIGEKAAFNNPPYAYGVVERTFSEWKSGALDDMPVSNFPNLPADLQVESGALNMAYQSGLLAGQGGNYEDGTIRTFSCQSCHMRPDIGEGCNKNPRTRPDLPKHDLSGGNYWMWPLIQYQDQKGTLRLGGDLTALQIEAMNAGQLRAQDQLEMAANLSVTGDTVKIVNLTGHKLITGYPEGRRMWLNIKWYDTNNTLLREDGAMGQLPGTSFTNPVDNQTFTPVSLLDLHDPNTKIYEAHYAITQEWAATMVAVDQQKGTDFGSIVLDYDRLTGEPAQTDGQIHTIAWLAAQPAGTYHETFHFVLNNSVVKDNRIPPYGMVRETARIRNALPVPDSQYGGGSTVFPNIGAAYEYWDELDLSATPGGIPAGAVYADITLYYQGTSWEYIQFLWLANNTPQGEFLADEGKNMLDAWINADPAAPMVPPHVMATATWGTPVCTPTEPTEVTCNDTFDNDCDGLIDFDDPDCQVCSPDEQGTELTCDDGIDNDCDGLIDVDDSDCQSQMACSSYSDKGACNNDPNCEWSGSPKSGSCGNIPVSEPTVEVCNDGVDNDCDGLVDCSDTNDCATDPACQVMDCSVYSTRNLCNEQPICTWSGKNKVCTNL